ncbi:ectoine hydroxylase-related dioxygenase (phytanoyl-CoA dioxygenase family) [Ruegeria conchae]|uniref:Ectoine hydroxylase-related dioxygenase (Phytanoyl-CoA dioxygenase family) n=2 Tax=Ruegeria conchae TaxID=981384 RepID=A0A497YUA7_9RHOB|nr:ectoine hydroxylase-related dioxygenase (phytanoyl-CoA dioxygenase family) [Ruegeria conchae]
MRRSGDKSKETAMTHPLVSQAMIDDFQTDGVVLVKGLFADHIETLRAGVAANMDEPGPYASENKKDGETGRFFDDYCNWSRIPQFREVIETSPAAEVAADLMQSQSVQMFHDHVLVKEPGTSMATPWHQDGPYYFVDGQQNISFWSPLDPVKQATLRCVAGSHRWEKEVLPTRWVSEEGFFPDEGQYMPIPDPDAEGMKVVEFEMEPGDAVAFNYRTLHGARGNTSDSRRRAFSLRLVGDDARYVERPGRTSPPFPGHDMVPGQRLREDWFPVLLQR